MSYSSFVVEAMRWEASNGCKASSHVGQGYKLRASTGMSASQASKAAATRFLLASVRHIERILLVYVTAFFPGEWSFEAHRMKLSLCCDVLFVLGIHSVEHK